MREKNYIIKDIYKKYSLNVECDYYKEYDYYKELLNEYWYIVENPKEELKKQRSSKIKQILDKK